MDIRSGNPSDVSWIDAEINDSLDEELELELDDNRVARELRDIEALTSRSTLER